MDRRGDYLLRLTLVAPWAHLRRMDAYLPVGAALPSLLNLEPPSPGADGSPPSSAASEEAAVPTSSTPAPPTQRTLHVEIRGPVQRKEAHVGARALEGGPDPPADALNDISHPEAGGDAATREDEPQSTDHSRAVANVQPEDAPAESFSGGGGCSSVELPQQGGLVPGGEALHSRLRAGGRGAAASQTSRARSGAPSSLPPSAPQPAVRGVETVRFGSGLDVSSFSGDELHEQDGGGASAWHPMDDGTGGMTWEHLRRGAADFHCKGSVLCSLGPFG